MTLSLPPVAAIIVTLFVKVMLGAAVQSGLVSLPKWATFVVAGGAGIVTGVLWVELSLPNTNRGVSE